MFYSKVNYNVWALNKLNENKMLLHFHGDFQDGVLRPLIKTLKNRSMIFLSDFSIYILNVAIIVLLILTHQLNDFLSVC